MTLTQLAHFLFGGCVTVRCKAGVWGVFSPMDAELWEMTATTDAAELPAKMRAVGSRLVRYRPQEAFAMELRFASRSKAEQTRRSVRRGAQASAAVTRGRKRVQHAAE